MNCSTNPMKSKVLIHLVLLWACFSTGLSNLLTVENLLIWLDAKEMGSNEESNIEFFVEFMNYEDMISLYIVGPAQGEHDGHSKLVEYRFEENGDDGYDSFLIDCGIHNIFFKIFGYDSIQNKLSFYAISDVSGMLEIKNNGEASATSTHAVRLIGHVNETDAVSTHFTRRMSENVIGFLRLDTVLNDPDECSNDTETGSSLVDSREEEEMTSESDENGFIPILSTTPTSDRSQSQNDSARISESKDNSAPFIDFSHVWDVVEEMYDEIMTLEVVDFFDIETDEYYAWSYHSHVMNLIHIFPYQQNFIYYQSEQEYFHIANDTSWFLTPNDTQSEALLCAFVAWKGGYNGTGIHSSYSLFLLSNSVFPNSLRMVDMDAYVTEMHEDKNDYDNLCAVPAIDMAMTVDGVGANINDYDYVWEAWDGVSESGVVAVEIPQCFVVNEEYVYVNDSVPGVQVWGQQTNCTTAWSNFSNTVICECDTQPFGHFSVELVEYFPQVKIMETYSDADSELKWWCCYGIVALFWAIFLITVIVEDNDKHKTQDTPIIAQMKYFTKKDKQHQWKRSKDGKTHAILTSSSGNCSKLMRLWMHFISNDGLFLLPLLCNRRDLGTNYTFKQRLINFLNLVLWLCLINVVGVAFFGHQTDSDGNVLNFSKWQLMFCVVTSFVAVVFHFIVAWLFASISPMFALTSRQLDKLAHEELQYLRRLRNGADPGHAPHNSTDSASIMIVEELESNRLHAGVTPKPVSVRTDCEEIQINTNRYQLRRQDTLRSFKFTNKTCDDVGGVRTRVPSRTDSVVYHPDGEITPPTKSIFEDNVDSNFADATCTKSPSTKNGEEDDADVRSPSPQSKPSGSSMKAPLPIPMLRAMAVPRQESPKHESEAQRLKACDKSNDSDTEIETDTSFESASPRVELGETAHPIGSDEVEFASVKSELQRRMEAMNEHYFIGHENKSSLQKCVMFINIVLTCFVLGLISNLFDEKYVWVVDVGNDKSAYGCSSRSEDIRNDFDLQFSALVASTYNEEIADDIVSNSVDTLDWLFLCGVIISGVIVFAYPLLLFLKAALLLARDNVFKRSGVDCMFPPCEATFFLIFPIWRVYRHSRPHSPFLVSYFENEEIMCDKEKTCEPREICAGEGVAKTDTGGARDLENVEDNKCEEESLVKSVVSTRLETEMDGVFEFYNDGSGGNMKETSVMSSVQSFMNSVDDDRNDRHRLSVTEKTEMEKICENCDLNSLSLP